MKIKMLTEGGVSKNAEIDIIDPSKMTTYKYTSQTLTTGLFSLYFNCNATSNYSWYFYSTTPIDLTDYSKIVLKGKLNIQCSGGDFEKGIILGLTDSTPSYRDLSDFVEKVSINDVGDFTLELDVSNINTSKYIKICCATYINQGYIYTLPLLIKK
jgi:hypothetical protein